MFVGISLLSDIVKVSVALTAAAIPVEPVNVIVLPVTTDWVVDPSDIVKPVPVTLVLISFTAATIELLAVVPSVAKSPISVPDIALTVVLNVFKLSVVATLLVAI
jgi:hypothetical protein